MYYFKLLGYAVFIHVIVVLNVMVFVGFDKLDKGDRVGYSIMTIIITAIVWLMVAAANSKNLNKNDGYPP